MSVCDNTRMEKCRNIRVGEDVWVRVKQRALDERVTVREVAERAFHAYLGGGAQRVEGRQVRDRVSGSNPGLPPSTSAASGPRYDEQEHIP